MKLDDTTVTGQLNMASSPIMEMAENAQQTTGRKTQRLFLKMIRKVTTRKSSTPIPKT